MMISHANQNVYVRRGCCFVKRNLLRGASFLLLFCFMLSFSSCIKMSEAKDVASEVFSCLSEARYEDAAALFHPSYGITAMEMEALVGVLAESYDADVKDGIVIERTVNYKASGYTTEVDGSQCEMTMNVEIGEKTLRATIVLVRNDAGDGITRLTFEQ